MRILSKMLNSLRVMTIKTSFTSGLAIFSYLDVVYLDNLASVFMSINVSNVSTYCKSFLDFFWPNLFNGKGAKGTNKITYIRATSIGSICTRDTYARGINIKDTFFTGGACINSAFIKGVCAKNTYIRSASAVKHLEMHSQSF